MSVISETLSDLKNRLRKGETLSKGEQQQLKYLEQIEAKGQQSEVIADVRNVFRQIVAQPWDGLFIHGNEANLRTIVGWLEPQESVDSISVDWFRNVIAEQPGLLSQLATTPTGALISVNDTEAINSWLRKKGFGTSTANINLIKGACTGPSFYEAQLEHVVQTGQLRLARPTEAEKQAIKDEQAAQATEQDQRRLLNASPDELKREIKSGAEQRQIAFRDQRDADHLEALRQRQEGQFPALPAIWQGHQLTPEFIRRCDSKTQRTLHRVYGSYQLELRLRGLA